jgi:hypothetical protein
LLIEPAEGGDLKLAAEFPVDSGKRDWRVRTVGGNGKVDGYISNTANYNVFVVTFMTPTKMISGQE